MLATTKQVRKIVRNFVAVDTASWTDKAIRDTRKADNGLRNVALRIWLSKGKQAALLENLELAMFAAGYTNKVKITYSEYNEEQRWGGFTYVRINNCVLA